MLRLASLALIASLFIASIVAAEDWPTAAHDAARSGRTADTAPGPYRVRWAKAWQYENIATVSQLIVAEGRGFIGTLGRDNSFAGRVHCVDLKDGRDLWSFGDMQGGIAHSLTWSPHAGGTVYAATTFGEVFALEAATGKQRWKFVTPLGGFVVNPCVADGVVMLGSRQGVFYALNEADGQPRWQRDLKVPICHTAAAKEGAVYFLDEAIRTHGLSTADGKTLPGWLPRQLHGGSARFYWPVVTDEHVLMTVAPPHQYNWGETDAVLFKTPRVRDRKGGDHLAPGTPEQEAAEQKEVISFLDSHPQNQTLHCLRKKDGKVASIPGVLHTGGSGSELAPPVLTKEGRIVVEYRSWYSLWDSDSWVNPYSALGTLDPATGVVTQLRPKLHDRRVPWGHVWIIADESSTFSVAGDTLFVAHQGNFGGMDLSTGQTFAGIGKRDTWGGYPPLSWNRQEWHGGPRSPLTIVDGTIYYVVGARVIACEGNVQGVAKHAEAEIVPSPDEIKPLPKLPAAKDWKAPDVAAWKKLIEDTHDKKIVIDEEATKVLRAELDAHVLDAIRYPLGPFYEWRGISPTERTFETIPETAFALARSFPYLTQETKHKVKGFFTGKQVSIDGLPSLHRYAATNPRNWNSVPKAVRQQIPTTPLTRRQDFPISYGAWWFVAAFDHEIDRDHLLVRSFAVGAATDPRRNMRMGESRENEYSTALTQHIGAAHLALKVENLPWFQGNVEASVPLAQKYVDHHRKVGRSCLEHIDALPGTKEHPSAGGQFRNLGGPYVGETHNAAIVYWTDLCPEMGRVLREYAPAETEAIRRWMLRNAQGFYLARWDTPVQEGEVCAPWYVTTQNYFHVFSTIGPADAATRRLLVDMPVCHADVYYIERLVAAIEAAERPAK